MSGLFRQEALDKVVNPDQLDRLMRVTHPLGWVALSLVIGLIAGATLWSTLSTAPVSVRATGLVMRPDGVFDIVAPSNGRLERLLVEIGAPVRAGQVVALLAQPELADQLRQRRAELEELRAQREQLIAFHRASEQIEARLQAEKSDGYKQRIVKLEDQRRWLRERFGNENDLFNKGYINRQRVLDTSVQIADIENQLAVAGNAAVELKVQATAQTTQRSRELLEQTMRVAEAERRLAAVEAAHQGAREIQATQSGKLVELTANAGEIVQTGQPVARLLPANHTEADLIAVVFVPPGDGKKIKDGMEVQLVPSTAKREKHGYMLGRVVRVAEIPSSRESLRRLLKNDTLVQQMVETGAPFEVRVALTPDAAAPSGFRWVSGKGIGAPVDAGTLASAQMVVDRVPLITLAIPATQHLWRWLGR